jgi:hypothetical protein
VHESLDSDLADMVPPKHMAAPAHSTQMRVVSWQIVALAETVILESLATSQSLHGDEREHPESRG